DEDVDLAHPVLLGAARGGLRRHLRGERGGLARPLEPDLAGAGPRDHRAGRVGDAHDRVVEGALDVRVSVDNVLLLFAAHLARGALTALRRHSLLPRSSIRCWYGPERRGPGRTTSYRPSSCRPRSSSCPCGSAR